MSAFARSLSRRRFFGEASCAAISSLPVLNTLLNLRLAGSLAAAELPAPGEYRALVCLFLSGGNDSFNTLVPWSGPEYSDYTASRSVLALPQHQLLQIHPDNTPGRNFGVHYRLPTLASLFDSGDAAFVANVGTLVEPVLNRTQVAQNARRLPLGLYSHSDQIEQWQTSVPQSRNGIGFAGRMADLLRDLNPNGTVPMNLSTDGSNVWQTGIQGAEYAINPGNDQAPTGGAVALSGYQAAFDANNPTRQAFSNGVDSLLTRQYTNLLQQTWAQKRRQAQEAYQLYATATAAPLPGGITFPNTSLGRQLHMVARTLAGRSTLGAVRQTFFVNRGGWDHHSSVIASQEAMLPEVDAALAAFWAALGVLGLRDQVTLFSASDFGRTLTSNGRGSDHAWGGHQFVIGGGVSGKKIYGSFPSLKVNPDAGAEVNALDTGRGRFIPTTSVDEFFAEMALWLGVPKSSLPLVLPNIGNFHSITSSAPPLGFLL
ncbi:MAG: hypothetical protein JWL81_2041 [Verrucomicrobiales bacterium]|nr:hypothetical protein [Verrucomicrobiales bacterium]